MKISQILSILFITVTTIIFISCDLFTEPEDSVPPLSITFDSNEGSNVSTQEINEGGKVVKPDDPTRTNYAFLNWYSDLELTTIWNFDDDTVSSDLTLYARWAERFTPEFQLLDEIIKNNTEGSIITRNITISNIESSSNIVISSVVKYNDSVISSNNSSLDSKYIISFEISDTGFSSNTINIKINVDYGDGIVKEIDKSCVIDHIPSGFSKFNLDIFDLTYADSSGDSKNLQNLTFSDYVEGTSVEHILNDAMTAFSTNTLTYYKHINGNGIISIGNSIDGIGAMIITTIDDIDIIHAYDPFGGFGEF